MKGPSGGVYVILSVLKPEGVPNRGNPFRAWISGYNGINIFYISIAGQVVKRPLLRIC
jgi:hypothetical protein